MSFISEYAKIIGLLFFFTMFCLIAFWAYRPSSKKKFERYGRMPLED